MSAEGSAVERVVAAIAAVLEGGPEVRADVWQVVSLIPGSELRGVVRVLVEEVALRTVAPAEDREAALERLRAQLVEALVARHG